MAETKIPAIYRVPSNTEPELKRYLESVQEALEVRLGRRGDELDQAVTYRDLIDSNLAQRASRLNRVVEPMIEEPTPSMPFNTIPQNVQASGAFTKIIVTWNDHQMGSLFARAEIWRASIDDLNAATLQASVYGSVWTDTVDYDTTMYYWVRFVQRATSVSGNETFGEFSSPAASATTAENISAVMTALSETLADMPGYNLLATSTTSATVIKAASSPSTRSNGDALQPNDLWFDTDDGQLYTRNTANNAWVAARDSTLVNIVGSTSYTGSSLTAALASAQSDVVTLTSANTARVSEITNLTATVDTKTKTFVQTSAPTATAVGDIWIDSDDNNKMYRASAVGSSNWVAVRDTANDNYPRVFTQASAPTAVNTGDLWFDSDDSNKQYRWDGSSWVEVRDITTQAAVTSEATARANGDSANATSITNLTSTVSGHTSSISTLNTTTASHTGDLNAMYVLTVATESNGSKSAAGMVIGSNSSDGSGAQSYVQFQADKFAIWSGSSNIAPFIVDSGVVYIDQARIKDGAILNAKIATGTIESAKIATLDADKIRSGTIHASTVLKIGSGGSGATDQRIEITAASNRILVVDDSS